MIPDFQATMRPLLMQLRDGESHSFKDVLAAVCRHFKLTQMEQQEMLPSQRQPTINNRVAWAKTYLLKAGLLQSPSRGVILITDEGLKALQSDETINVAYLNRYPSFIRFHAGKNKVSGHAAPQPDPAASTDAEQDPETVIAQASDTLNAALSDELMDNLLKMKSYDFEKLVIDLLGKMGYNPDEEDRSNFLTKKSGDEGLDGIIKVDKLGFDAIGIQAKLWAPDQTIGRPKIQEFAGALGGKGLKNGIFVTTAQYSKQAKEYYHSNTKIILIDGTMLTDLMIRYNIGVQIKNLYEIKRLDLDYFDSF